MTLAGWQSVMEQQKKPAMGVLRERQRMMAEQHHANGDYCDGRAKLEDEDVEG